MSELGKSLAAAALVALGVSAYDDPTDYRTFRQRTQGPPLSIGPPKPLTKRQKRRLRGKKRSRDTSPSSKDET
jgi:hypothetical protein